MVWIKAFSKGAVHKKRPQLGGGVCPVRRFFGQGGRGNSSNADARKTLDFLKFMKCPHGQRRGLS